MVPAFLNREVNMDTAMVIQRAEIIYDLIDERINDSFDVCPHDFIEAMKASFAIKGRSLALYRRAYKDTNMEIDIRCVANVYAELSEFIPGPNGLSSIEVQLIEEINESIENSNRIWRA